MSNCLYAGRGSGDERHVGTKTVNTKREESKPMQPPVDRFMECNMRWCKHLEFDDLEPTELSLQQEPDEVFMFWSDDQLSEQPLVEPSVWGFALQSIK